MDALTGGASLLELAAPPLLIAAMSAMSLSPPTTWATITMVIHHGKERSPTTHIRDVDGLAGSCGKGGDKGEEEEERSLYGIHKDEL